MQILRTTTPLVLSCILAMTAAFSSSLRQELFGNQDFPAYGRLFGLQNTDYAKQSVASRLSKTIRDLVDAAPYSQNRKKRVTTDTSGTSPNVNIPSSSSGVNDVKRGEDIVQVGTGQTVSVLRPYPEPSDVGFHVSLSQTTTVTGSDATVVFDTIHESTPAYLNGYYNSRTGKFTCPVTGTYLVSLSIANKADDVMLASVYVNQSHKKMTVVSDGRYGITQGSQTGYVKLNKNDVLYVSIDRPTFAQVYGNNLSSFSVYLLKKQ